MRIITILSEQTKRLITAKVNEMLDHQAVSGITRMIMHECISKAIEAPHKDISFYKSLNLVAAETMVRTDEMINILNASRNVPFYHALFDIIVDRLFIDFGHDPLDYCGSL